MFANDPDQYPDGIVVLREDQQSVCPDTVVLLP